MNIIQRVFPAPIMSALVFVVWLLVNESMSVGHVLIAAGLALVIPPLTLPLRGERPRIKAWGTVIRLGIIVIYDIILSNIELARRVLGPEDKLHPEFMWIPLELTDEHAIVAFAGIITMTPGTLSCDIADDRRHLLVHGFNVDDPAAAIVGMKERYEKPLKEIFE
jgi:multicomponent K+:H+ antiporter subunit E